MATFTASQERYLSFIHTFTTELWLVRKKMAHRHQHIVTRRAARAYVYRDFLPFCLAYASGYYDIFFPNEP